MKRLFFILAVFALMSQVLWAQGNDADKLEIGVAGTFAKPKIIPSMTKLAVAQVVVNYQLTTTTRTVSREKSTGAIAGAKLTAFLETTDGKLEDADFQEITDHFYNYLQKKLAANGVDTVAWSKIAASEFYQSSAEKTAEGSGLNGQNVWVTKSAHQGNVLYGGNIAFTFGRAKKAGKFCEEMDAPAAFINVTLDFADVMVGVDIKSQSHEGLFTIEKSLTWKYDASVLPQMTVVPTNLGMSLFWNEKMVSESLYPKADIAANDNYAEHTSQDQSRMKNSLWAFSKEMNPVVIETTKAKYKEAAKHALERYADALVAKHNQLK